MRLVFPAIVAVLAAGAFTQTQTQTQTLVPGSRIEQALTCGETHAYRLDLASGDYVEIVAERRGVDVVLQAVSPAGDMIDQAWREARLAGATRLVFAAPVDGAFTVRARCPDGPPRSGRYELRLEVRRAATSADRDRLDAEQAFAAGEREREIATADAARQALVRYEDALRLWRRAGDERGEADALGGLSRANYLLAQAARALEYGEQALVIYRRLGNRFAEALVLSFQGTIQWALGAPDRALALYGQARPIVQEVGDPEGEAYILHSTGVLLQLRGDTAGALDAFERAVPVWRALGHPVGEGTTLNAIAISRADLGEFQQSLDAYQQALGLLRSGGDRRTETLTLTNLGIMHDALGDVDAALQHHEQALALARTLGDRRAEASVLSNIGRSHYVNARPARAIPYLREALPLRQATGNRQGEARTLGDLGLAHAATGDSRQAEELLAKALALHRAIKDRRGEAETLSGLAETKSTLGAREPARALYLEAVTIFQEMGEQRRQARSLSLLARLERDMGHLGDARAHLERSLELVETSRASLSAQERRAGFFAQSRSSYELYVDVLMRLHAREPALGLDALALATSERARARSLVEMLADAHTPLGADLAAQPLTAPELQREVLDEGSVLIEYLLGDDRSHVWVVTRESITAIELPARSVIEASARRVYDLLIAGTRREARTQTRLASAELSAMILGPIADRLGTRRLLIVPDGALHYIPFAALPDPATRGVSAGGDPLIVRHEIVTLPSASTVAIVRRERGDRQTAQNGVAIVADPVLDRRDPRVRTPGAAPAASTAPAARTRDVTRSAEESGFPHFERLPFARQEAEAIARLAGPTGTFKAFDFAATRQAVTSPALGGYRIVHLATHGLLNSQHPELSGMVLSLVDEQGQPQDGFLRLRDIYDLKLGADLVVLSACRTALGKDIRGEGLVGLTRGFLSAGAKAVIASLWDVRDQATAELMTRFYRRLLEDRVGAAAALRDAQLSMWREPRWQAPYYWSGFVLQGEWKD